MKKGRQKVKQVMIWFTAILMAVGIFARTKVMANRRPVQSVNVTVNILPPYSPYYADYSGINAGKVLLTIQNLTASQLKIKLVGGLKGNNGISITTYSNYTPLQPIILNPHEIRQLNGLALKDIFDINNLSVIGVDKNKLAQTSRIPEGMYSFCLQAVDYNNAKLFYSESQGGCTNFLIQYPKPPILIGPAPFMQVPVTNPQTVVFNWTNPGTVPIGTQYTIQMAQMPDVAQDPTQVLNATSLPILSKTVNSLGYLYGIGDLALTPGKKYAWRVIANDPTGKVEFENKGVSAAAVFVYGQSSLNPVLASAATNTVNNLLNIVTPDCHTNPNPTLVVGPNSKLNLNWLWHEQIDSLTMFGLIDSNILQHYTKLQTKDGPLTIKGYAVNLQKVSNNYPRKKSPDNVSFGLSTPDQKLSLTEQEVFNKGLVLGEDYVMKVTAYNSAGGIITTATSCTFKLRSEQQTGLPKLNVSGRLAYAFDKLVYNGANKASISMQLVDYPTTKINPYGVSASAHSQPWVVFDNSKEIVSVTTDSQGNFNTQFTQTPADTGHKYVMIRINSPYYKTPEQNMPVIIPKIALNNNGGGSYKQDTLKMGDIKTDVYNYNLTVNMMRGFGGGLTDADWKAYYGVNPIDKFGNSLVDTLSINPKAKIPAGMIVSLYRKTKASDIPRYEGDSVAAGKPVLEHNRGDSRTQQTIKVAEAATTIVYDANKNPKTVVVFKNLVCNLEQGDVYFIKAKLTDADTLGNSNKDATAPEQRITYNKIYNWRTPHYETAVDYRIISKKPPTAHVKGKVMYQWPSAPGVLHPYKGRLITVSIHASGVTGNYDDLKVPAADPCQYYEAALVEPVKQPDGSTYYRPVPQYKEGATVASGYTDEKGNFDIEVLDLTQMGPINVMTQKTSDQVQGLTCADQKKQDEKVQAQAIKDAAKTGSINLIDGFSHQDMKDMIAGIMDKVKNGDGEMDGDLIGFGDTGTGTGGYTNYNIGQGGSMTVNGVTYKTGGGIAATGLTINSGTGFMQQHNAAPNSFLIPNLGSSDLFGGGAGNSPLQGGQSLMHFDQESPFGPSRGDEQPESYSTLDRFFTLDGFPDSTMQNKSSVNKTSHFVVQPFETVDLGTLVMDVPELKAKLKIYVNNSISNAALTNAKVVVFRSPYAPNLSPVYDGEGSVQHPSQKLLNPQFGSLATYTSQKEVTAVSKGGGTNYLTGFTTSSYQDTDRVVWVIDHPLTVALGDGNSGTIDLSNLRLYGYDNMAQYALQITPGAEGSGGTFAPLVVTLPIHNTEAPNDDDYVHAFVSNNKFGSQVIDEVKNQALRPDYKGYDPYGIYVELSPSRIAGRVINGATSNGLKNASAVITIGAKTYNITTLDTTGYFELVNGQTAFWNDNPTGTITASAPGYTPDIAAAQFTATKQGMNIYRVVKLNPSATVIGRIVDESGKEVDSYIVNDEGTVYTSADFKKGIPLVSKMQHLLRIEPKDAGYFEDTLKITVPDGTTNLPDFKVYRRQHRMAFKVTASDGSAVPDEAIQVIINNDPKLSAMVAGGQAKIVFENVSVYNYSVQVTDTKKLGFIPKIFNLHNDESKVFRNYSLALDKGATVTGKVSMNNQPVANARVYIDYAADKGAFSPGSNGAADKAGLEDYTDNNGMYTIAGIPVTDNNQVTLHATLNAAYNVNGGSATVTINNNKAAANFVLTKFGGQVVNSIFGFPLSVEKIESAGGANVKVTGIVDLSSNSSSFGWLDNDSKIRVSDVIFTPQQVGGATVMQPQATSVSLDGISQIKMKYQDKYNVLLTKGAATSNGTFQIINSLTVDKNGNGGAVMAKVSITDNSFNFPSSYLSFADPVTQQPIPFYLSAQGANSSAPNQTTIRALYNVGKPAGLNYQNKNTGVGVIMGAVPDYYLSDANGDALKFKFIGFNTTAAPYSSFIDKSGKIHLDATVNGKIPNSTPGDVSVHISNLVLDGNTIQASKGNDPIIVDLQTWKLQVNNWSIDPKQGGIYSENSLVKTGIVDIPAKLFNLRSDLFVLDKFDVSNISLGGGLVNLTGINASNTHLVFDQACGSDHGAHWRFSAVGDGSTPVATVPLPAIQDKAPASNLNVDYFQLVSYNNENLVNLSPNQQALKLYNNNRFNFLPQSIGSGSNYFTIAGQTTFDVPRLPVLAMSLVYKKLNNTLDVAPSDLNLKFEGKGYVQFTNDQSKLITIENGDTKISGTVVEPGKFNPIPCDLLFGTNNPGKIRLQKDFNVNLDGEGPATPTNLSLSITDALSNGMMVDNTKDWSTLKFSGPLNDPKSGAMVTKKPTYNFEVLGDITASASKIEMSQVSTPLGDVNMSYDFASKTMHGSLHMNEVGFGSNTFTGDVQMTYGPKGMLLLGAGQLNTGVLLVDGFGTFNIGMLFANTNLTADNIKTVTEYSKAKETQCWLSDNANNFKGFFIDGGYDIINEHDGFDIGIAALSFDADLGVEMAIGANFTNTSFMGLLGAHGDVNVSLSAITGTSVSGGLSAHLTAMAAYAPGGFSIDGDAGLGVHYQVCQYIPFAGTSCFGGSKGATMLFHYGKGSTKFKFSLNSDGNAVTCNQSTNK